MYFTDVEIGEIYLIEIDRRNIEYLLCIKGRGGGVWTQGIFPIRLSPLYDTSQYCMLHSLLEISLGVGNLDFGWSVLRYSLHRKSSKLTPYRVVITFACCAFTFAHCRYIYVFWTPLRVYAYSSYIFNFKHRFLFRYGVISLNFHSIFSNSERVRWRRDSGELFWKFRGFCRQTFAHFLQLTLAHFLNVVYFFNMILVFLWHINQVQCQAGNVRKDVRCYTILKLHTKATCESSSGRKARPALVKCSLSFMTNLTQMG